MAFLRTGHPAGRRGACIALLVALLTTGCAAAAPRDHPGGAVTVFAAGSLAEAFTDLADEVEGSTVVLNAGGSQQLARQILDGAPADVFAAADQRQMDVVADAGLLAGDPQVFASNELALAVEPGNPREVRSLADLARRDLSVVLAAPDVPVGRYARQALDAAGVDVEPVSLELEVRDVVRRVALGEADAGIVYASDVRRSEGRIDGVALPETKAVDIRYPVAALRDAPNPAGAAAFVDLILSERGRAVLAEHGLTAP